MSVDAGPLPDEPGYKPAAQSAAVRHNAVLREHTCRPMSIGAGLLYYCNCGVTGSATAIERHHFEICRDTPVASR